MTLTKPQQNLSNDTSCSRWQLHKPMVSWRLYTEPFSTTHKVSLTVRWRRLLWIISTDQQFTSGWVISKPLKMVNGNTGGRDSTNQLVIKMCSTTLPVILAKQQHKGETNKCKLFLYWPPLKVWFLVGVAWDPNPTLDNSNQTLHGQLLSRSRWLMQIGFFYRFFPTTCDIKQNYTLLCVLVSV